MAEKSLFHMRRRLNTLVRASQTRPYAVRTVQQARVHEEQIQYLRAQDQKLLEDTKRQCDKLIEHVRKTQAAITALPTTVQRDPTIQPYQLGGYLRERIREAPAVAAKLIQKTEHIKEHLTDLQHEPYPESDQSETAKWAEQIARMSTEEKEEQLEEMKIKEVAEMARLKHSSEGLLRRIQEIEAMSAKREGALDEPVKAPNPFQSDGGKSAAGKEEGKDGKAESKPTSSLADRMARLERRG